MPISSVQKPPRAYPSVNAVHCIRVQINQASPIAVSGQRALKTGISVPIGTIPAGSFILPPSRHTLVAFNGTTPAIVVGNGTDPAAYVPAAATLEAVGFAGAITSGTGLGFVAEDTVVYIKATWTGANTTGQFDVILPFYPARD
jgi:hypothetical protein